MGKLQREYKRYIKGIKSEYKGNMEGMYGESTMKNKRNIEWIYIGNRGGVQRGYIGVIKRIEREYKGKYRRSIEGI